MLLFLFAIVFTSMMSGQPNEGTSSKQTATKPKTPVSVMGTQQHQNGTQNTGNKSDDHPPKWYTPLEGPDWWLVIIAAVTGFAIAYQAREMARATDAMKEQVKLQSRAIDLQARSIDLQERFMQQWVDYGNWKGTLGFMEFDTEQEMPFLNVYFEIKNTTKFPITLPHPTFVFTVQRDTPHKLAPWLRDNLHLIPDQIESIHVTFPVQAGERNDYERGMGITMTVDGDVSHIGALERQVMQRIFGLLTCRSDGAAVFIPMTPQPDEPPEHPEVYTN